jgi:hypothetical protein
VRHEGILLHIFGPGGDQQFAVRYSTMCQRLGGLFEAPLAHVLSHVATPGTIRPKRPQEAARVVLRTVGYLTMDCTLHPPPNEDAYVEETAEMLTRYLAADP